MPKKKKPADHQGSKGASIPEIIRPKYEPILVLVRQFCLESLNEEYFAMCEAILNALARKRPSPLMNGAAAAWAAGIVRAIGHVNFLSDPAQKPTMKVTQIDNAFGVSQAAAQGKSKKIRDLFKMTPFDPTWTLPSMMSQNPLANLISVGGFLMDARHAPQAVQEEVIRRGLIPDETIRELPAKIPNRDPGKTHLYTLEVFITQGMIEDAFVKKNPVISRIIEIRGDQTLADLHRVIFNAFDRFDEHLYEFNFGTGPYDRDAQRFQPAGLSQLPDDNPAMEAETATIESIGLEVGDSFGYLFDFGDEWMHQIDVNEVADAPVGGDFPRIISGVGESPPQYSDDDEE